MVNQNDIEKTSPSTQGDGTAKQNEAASQAKPPRSDAKKTPRKAASSSRRTSAKAKPPTSSKKTTRKSASRAPTSATTGAPKRKPRTRAPSAPAAPVIASETAIASTAPELKKQELLAAIVAETGAKKRDVKPVLEAMLRTVGSALQEGRSVNLEPLGKVRVNRTKTTQNKQISILKLRQSKLPEKDPQDPLASAAE